MKTTLIALPRCALGNISPMMAGLSTLLATAQPVRNRAKMSKLTDWLRAEMATPAMKRTLQALKTG